MAINKKLITFATEAQFDAYLADNSIDPRSIVFIEDKKRIWTHGVFFDTSWDYITDKPDAYTPSAHTHNYLSDSPQDGKIYGRKNGDWTEVDSDMYDWMWLDDPTIETCTQQQYDDLLAAVQTGKLFPHPVNSFVFPIEEIEGDAIILNMIRILGNDAMFAFWGILPDLTVESNFFSLEGVVQQIVSQQSIKLGETYNTAYRGDRGKIAYDHSQTAHDYVPTNSFKGSTFTTSVIPLNNPLGSFRVATASNVATYTLSTTKVIGAWAKIRVNRATAPTVTGGTLIKGSGFIPYTDMYLYVSYDGTKSEYYFAEI